MNLKEKTISFVDTKRQNISENLSLVCGYLIIDTKAHCTRGFFPLPVFGMEALFAIWRPVGIEMTSLLTVLLDSLLDLKDRRCSVSRLGPGKPFASRKQTKTF